MFVIICTSHLFLANALFAYAISNNVTKNILICVYVSSMFHWITYEPDSLFHYVDLITSRVATISLIVYSMNYVHYYYCIMALHTIVLTYAMSRCMYVQYPDNTYWILCHAYFHIVTNFCIYVFLINYRNYKWYGITNNIS